jgi:hypothetical protein
MKVVEARKAGVLSSTSINRLSVATLETWGLSKNFPSVYCLALNCIKAPIVNIFSRSDF